MILSIELGCLKDHSETAFIAISAALLFGKWNSPVDIQQNARLFISFSKQIFNVFIYQSSRFFSNSELSSLATIGPTICITFFAGRLYASVSIGIAVGCS